MSHDVIVIGGGIGGLTTAFRVRQQRPQARIALLESSDRFGGVVATRRADDLVLELGPDSLIRTKPAGMQLISELGLDAQVQDTDPRFRASLIARGDRLLAVPDGLYLLAPGRWLPFLRSPLVSWPGKLRMGLDLVLPRGPAARGEDESLAAFVRRRLGREALERIAQPMIGGIYTADPERLSLPFTMPQFVEMEREHRSLLLAMRARARSQAAHANASGPRYGLFASLIGGLQTLTDALVGRLAGSDLRTGCVVNSVRRTTSGWSVATAHGELTAPALAICTPAHAAGHLLHETAPELARHCLAVPYAGVATVNLVYDRAAVPALPPAAGFVVPAVEGRSLIAATFCHQKYAGRSPDDRVVIRAFVGGASHAARLAVGDADMLAALAHDLRGLLGITVAPLTSVISRWDAAMAQPVIGHRERVTAIRRSERAIPGLALVGNGYEGVGIPDIIAQAQTAANRLSGSSANP
jgi:oxygen-dependent protoporphyrinogen oxidase